MDSPERKATGRHERRVETTVSTTPTRPCRPRCAVYDVKTDISNQRTERAEPARCGIRSKLRSSDQQGRKKYCEENCLARADININN